ncbi:hypothetical protein EZV62_026460 [Acer yangbiense]|uniref:Integrase catalytic domain-containing protein n=1 Tax=Acer yangbiense TaxID=1000413 RepID=A0A5C7GSS0_9ROSI|nr:hypothetical protein EZV62_026460 [Acer yangbiense]
MAGSCGGNQVRLFDFLVSWFVKWDADIVGLFCVVLWRVWFNRNQVTHGKAGLDLREVVGWAENFLTEYRSANQVQGHHLAPLCNRNVSWRPPSYGRYKFQEEVEEAKADSIDWFQEEYRLVSRGILRFQLRKLGGERRGKKNIVIIVCSVVGSMILIIFIGCSIFLRMRKTEEDYESMLKFLLLFLLFKALGCFRIGVLSNGQQIAVKRMSMNSKQGDLEFQKVVLQYVVLSNDETETADNVVNACSSQGDAVVAAAVAARVDTVVNIAGKDNKKSASGVPSIITEGDVGPAGVDTVVDIAGKDNKKSASGVPSITEGQTKVPHPTKKPCKKDNKLVPPTNKKEDTALLKATENVKGDVVVDQADARVQQIRNKEFIVYRKKSHSCVDTATPQSIKLLQSVPFTASIVHRNKANEFVNKASASTVPSRATNAPFNVFIAAKDNTVLWHAKLGHPSSLNGVPERKHRAIVEMGLTLLAHANLPIKFWNEAFSTAVILINNLPTAVLRFMSPFEKMFGLFQRFDSFQYSSPANTLLQPTSIPVMQAQSPRLSPRDSQMVGELQAQSFGQSDGPSLSSTRAPISSDNSLQPTNSEDLATSDAAPVINAHPMITRGKTGSLKPRVFLSECSLPTSLLSAAEPKSVKAAITDPKCVQCVHRVLDKRKSADEDVDHMYSSSHPYTGLAICVTDQMNDQALHQRSRAMVKKDRNKVNLGG